MKKSLLLIALAFAAVACTKSNVDPMPRKGRQMVFGEVRGATLPEGTKIGLFVGSPVNYSNEILNVGADGSVTSANDLFWQAEQTQRSMVFAYSPYKEGLSAEGDLAFSVNTDQSTEAAFKASDLIANYKAAVNPQDEKINIAFDHLFSRVELYFDNRTEQKIEKVEISPVAISASVDLGSGDWTTGTEKATVRAFEGEKSFFAIIPPQKVAINVKVTLADDSTFEYELDEADFEAGKSHNNESSPLKVGMDAPKQISFSFSVTDWVDGGSLHLKGEEGEGGEDDPNVDTIASLVATATSTESSFEVKLKNAVVTYRVSNYTHLEDNSGAVHVFCSSSLKAGDVVNGTVKGKIKTYKNLPEITSIDLTGATVTTTTELPLTTLTISQLLANYDRYMSCRILIEGVTVTKGISSGTTSSRTGSISQSGSSIAIYAMNSSAPATLATGASGDLITFPSIYDSTKQLAIYEASQLTTAPEPEAENTVFAKNTTTFGVYGNTDTDAPAPSLTYVELKDQVACGTTSTGRNFSLASLENNTWCTLSLDIPNPKIGDTGTANYSASNGTAATYNVKVVNRTESSLWLEDKTSHVGFIIAY